MEYSQKAVKDLIPYINNARTHSDEQVTQIASSIREFGFINPIIIDDKNNVIAGHGRLLASKKLGLKEVPTVLVDHLTDTQRKAYVLADNQLALNAGWDDELLKLELAQLDDVGFDLELLGFDLDALDDLNIGEECVSDFPELPEGDRMPFQQKTFTLHDEQATLVDDAVNIARKNPLVDTGLNENSNGNALAFICKQFLGE
jgi:hypothetical protein